MAVLTYFFLTLIASDSVMGISWTGMAFINVSADGENNIVLVSGANHRIQPAGFSDEIALINVLI